MERGQPPPPPVDIYPIPSARLSAGPKSSVRHSPHLAEGIKKSQGGVTHSRINACERLTDSKHLQG